MPRAIVNHLEKGHDLPPCEGPKLQRFKDYRHKIKFISLLSQLQVPLENTSEGESPGGHGHVFEVEIRKSRFALKVVGKVLHLGSGLAS